VQEWRMPRSTAVFVVAMLTACGGATVDAPRPAPPAVVQAAGPKDEAPPTRDDGRLPPGVRPLRYALELDVDPAILGGLVVKIGSRMIDGSIRTKLNMLAQAMKG